MEGCYPVMMEGKPVGQCELHRQGARTEFFVRCAMREGIVRLAVYGREKECYLGIPIPEEGELRLRRIFSPAAMGDFPEEIIEIAPAGQGRAAMAVWEDEKGADEALTETDATAAGEEQTAEEEQEEEEELCWYASPDGALVCFDGERSLVALPPGDSRIPDDRKGQRRRIEGREYLVYVTKNSRIID